MWLEAAEVAFVWFLALKVLHLLRCLIGPEYWENRFSL